MKIKINKAFLAISFSTVLISGCGNSNEGVINTPKEEEKENISAEEKNNNEELSFKTEEDIINYFVSQNSKLEEAYNSETWNNFKKTCYNISKTSGDFILEGGSIGGYTFSELSSEAKEKIINLSLSADKKIVEYFPEYKEKIKLKYTNIKNKVKEVVIDFVGLEEYEFWSDKKDEVVDWSKEKINNGKEKIKELYKDYKNNNESGN